MFVLNSNEPINIAHLKKLANQSMFGERTCDRKAKKTLVVWYREERYNRKKIEIWAISTGFC